MDRTELRLVDEIIIRVSCGSDASNAVSQLGALKSSTDPVHWRKAMSHLRKGHAHDCFHQLCVIMDGADYVKSVNTVARGLKARR